FFHIGLKITSIPFQRGLLWWVPYIARYETGLVFLAASAWAAAVLIHGRLLGRLSSLVFPVEGARKKRAGHQNALRPWLAGVWTFPWYAKSLPVWVILSCGCFVVCTAHRLLGVIFRPWH